MNVFQFGLRTTILIVLLISNAILSQQYSNPIEAYEYIQSLRDTSNTYTVAASSDSIKVGIGYLKKALIFLNTPEIVELSNQSPSLKNKPIDVYYDLALAYMKMNERDKAIECLENIQHYALGQTRIIEFLKEETAFVPLHEEPRFITLLANFDHYASIFNLSSVFKPYSQNLSINEKILCLTIFWNEVRNRFVHFNLVPKIDWNKEYSNYLTKVQKTKSSKDFFQVFKEFCALLNDSHTNVFPPDELRDSVYARPPFRTDLIDDKVIVTSVIENSLESIGVRIGVELLTVDETPVKEYAKNKVLPYASSSTKQDRNKRVYNYELLAGNLSEHIKIKFKDKNDNIIDCVIKRVSPSVENKKEPFVYKALDKNISYCALNSFNSEETSNLFEKSLPQILASDALILDVRNNGGGGVKPWRNILSYLTDKEFSSIRARTRASISDLTWNEHKPSIFKPNGDIFYSKPVVLLIGNGTFSAAEDFCVAFDFMKRGKLIGEPTAGSSGEPFFFNLPGGFSARVCSKHDLYPDGKEFVGIGIQPDILISQTINDERNGCDAVLEAALNYLDSIIGKE